jgi:hypothetical protein
MLSARRNEDDGCQFVEEAVIEARTFQPFVRAATHGAWCDANVSHTTRQRAEAILTAIGPAVFTAPVQNATLVLNCVKGE